MSSIPGQFPPARLPTRLRLHTRRLRDRLRLEWDGIKFISRDLLRALPYVGCAGLLYALLYLAMSL